MKKILYYTSKKEYVEDLELSFIVSPDADAYELTCITNVDELEKKIKSFKPDLLVVSYDDLNKRDSWDFDNVEVAYHPRTKEELASGAKSGLKAVGVSSDPPSLISNLKKDPVFPSGSSKKPQEKKPEKVQQKAKEESPIQEKPKKKEPVEKAPVKSAPAQQKPSRQKPEFEYEEKTLDVLDEEEEDLYEDFNDMDQNDSDDDQYEREYEEEYQDGDDIIEDGFQRDMGKRKDNKTKVVSVYSAKGGVGKTTIATEVATYLACVSDGRDHLRVCLLDYNIDFGDVLKTLNMPKKGPTMTGWSAEIHELMENGKAPYEIEYTKEDIEGFLREDTKSGLFVLPAPATNTDSMEVDSDSLEVIIRNVINNGEFDFVICDTGNNTRDSTMIALEYSDIILMIMTQNVNTANCDKAFMQTMQSIDFDLSNTKLVINNILPTKATGISPQDIIEHFPEVECIGQIKYNTDVIMATNQGEPLAYKPDNEFTKQLRRVVAYLLNKEEFEAEPKKKGLFGFLFKKKS